MEAAMTILKSVKYNPPYFQEYQQIALFEKLCIAKQAFLGDIAF